MLTVCSPKEANSSMNVTQTHNKSNSISFSMIFTLKKIASCKVVDVRISFIIMILFDVAKFGIP